LSPLVVQTLVALDTKRSQTRQVLQVLSHFIACGSPVLLLIFADKEASLQA
jgi:hypothetical protein